MYEPSPNSKNKQVASSSALDGGGHLGLSVTAQRRRELQLLAEQQQYQEQVPPLSTRNGDEVAL